MDIEALRHLLDESGYGGWYFADEALAQLVSGEAEHRIPHLGDRAAVHGAVATEVVTPEPHRAVDLVAGRPWVGLGNELKNIRFKP